MLPKKIAYILFAIIGLLSVIFGYNLYSNHQKSQTAETKINSIIFKFEKKFKNDSIYLANANKLLIDKISQHLIDSVSNVYEKELESALRKVDKYKELLIANNIDFDGISNNSKSNDRSFTSNVTTSNSKPTITITSFPEQKTESNVTTYSKLKNKIAKKEYVSDLNITTYSKLKNDNSNVTTYSKLPNSKLSKDDNNIIEKPNVTTYTELKSIPTKKSVSYNSDSKTNQTKNKSTSLLNHNNHILNVAKNINSLDNVPVYPGCENQTIEKDKKNCFAVNISKHILKNFNSSNVQNIGLNKGIHKVRVLFVIDENGNAKIGKLVGEWHHKIYETVKSSIKSVPKMKPGIASNKPVSVKYSLLIPFIIQ